MLKDKLFKNLTLQSKAAKLWVEQVRDRCSMFDFELRADGESKIEMNKDDRSIISVNQFKEEPYELYHRSQPMMTCFLSSGTTSTRRSQSFFSAEGLLLYKIASLLTFDEVLSAYFGSQWHQKIQGYSLIPPITVWQQSSLAQMLSWIAQYAPVQFITAEALAELKPTEPTWLMGTAFHFVHFFDDYQKTVKLHPASIVIETGGLKGRAREIEQEQYFELLQDLFALENKHVVSEYGMCELASQAYCWDRGHLMIDRYYKFPFWVKIKAMQTLMSHDPDMRAGAMVICDEARTDLRFKWLATHDFVTVDPYKGSFALHGRLPQAPLKGCSLLAEQDKAVAQHVLSYKQDMTQNDVISKHVQSTALFSRASQILEHWVKDPQTEHLLRKELNQQDLLIKKLLGDLIYLMPESPEAWKNAAANAFSQGFHDKWLFIAPANHSLALVYPLFMAALTQCEMAVRLPRGGARPSLEHFLNFLKHSLGTQIQTLEPSFVLNVSSSQDFKGYRVFAMGQDTTLESLAKELRNPVYGFGDSFAATLISGACFTEHFNQVAYDAFSLAQRGCVNTRMVAIKENEAMDFTVVAEALTRSFLVTFGESLQPQEQAILFHEELALLKHAVPYWRCQPKAPLFYNCDVHDTISWISSCPFALAITPVFRGMSVQEWLKKLKQKMPALKYLYVDEADHQILSYPAAQLGVQLKLIGTSQKIAWDGFFEGRPLFSIHDCENYIQ